MNKTALLIAIIIILGVGYLLLADRGVEEASEEPLLEDEPTQGIMEITSSAFTHNGVIPSKYTCDGENVNPPLEIRGIPEGAQSLALIMDDPDIPQEVKESAGIDVFDHWVVFNIPTSVEKIAEGDVPGTQGANSRGESAYTGPCPPPEYEPREHRYFFKLYALDTELGLSAGATKEKVERAMEGRILDQAELIGRYSREQG